MKQAIGAGVEEAPHVLRRANYYLMHGSVPTVPETWNHLPFLVLVTSLLVTGVSLSELFIQGAKPMQELCGGDGARQ
jgi:hypothetical protein